MAKKKKQKKKMPPLGWQDKCIYALGYVLILALAAGLAVLWYRVRQGIAWSDPEVRAVQWSGSYMLAVPFGICLPLTLLSCWSSLDSKRYPFFGKKGVQYGPPKYPNTLPLFMKNKPDYWQSPSEKQMRRWKARLLVGFNLCLLLLVPFSLTGRTALYADGTARVYGTVGQEKADYSPRDVEDVTVQAYAQTRRHGKGIFRRTSTSYHVSIGLTMVDGTVVTFTEDDFRSDRPTRNTGSLTPMLEALEQYPAYRIGYENTELVPTLAEDWNLTAEEAEILYEIFGMA